DGQIWRSIMSLDDLGRKTMLALVLFMLGMSVFLTVVGVRAAWHRYVGEWENYQGQPVNSILALAISICCIPIFSVFAYKMLTNPKFTWRGNGGISSQNQQMPGWPRPKHRKRR